MHLHIPTVDFLYAPSIENLHQGADFIHGKPPFSEVKDIVEILWDKGAYDADLMIALVEHGCHKFVAGFLSLERPVSLRCSPME